MSDQDIREWAKNNGYPDIGDSGRLPPGAVSKYNRAMADTLVDDAPVDVDFSDDSVSMFDGLTPEDTEITEERIPDSGPSTVGKGIRSALTRARKATKPDPPRTSRRKVWPRVPLDTLLSHVWTIGAQIIQPINVPVSRVLAIQAPVAGSVLEKTVKDTALDRILQPIARMESKGETVFALLGPPIIVAAITQKPQLATVLVPMLRQALRSWIEVAGPHMEKIRKQEEKFAEEYGTQIDTLIEFILAPIEEPTNAAPTV